MYEGIKCSMAARRVWGIIAIPPSKTNSGDSLEKEGARAEARIDLPYVVKCLATYHCRIAQHSKWCRYFGERKGISTRAEACIEHDVARI
jgi:hypothetical protein